MCNFELSFLLFLAELDILGYFGLILYLSNAITKSDCSVSTLRIGSFRRFFRLEIFFLSSNRIIRVIPQGVVDNNLGSDRLADLIGSDF